MSVGRGSVLLGLVGEGITASLTPALQEREGRASGLDLVYRTIDTARLGLGAGDLPAVLEWAERLGFDGLNVTHPHKQAVLPLLDAMSDDAADLGAVNTVVWRDGRRIGHNTDWSGFAHGFRAALDGAEHDRAVVLGAGGAGAAVGYGLLDQGAARVVLLDLDGDRAEACAVRLAKRFGDDRVDVTTDLAQALADADGLVNATPIGMHDHPGLPVPEHLVHPDRWVADVVYRPLDTALVRLARERGCRVATGGGMAVHQAVGAFQLFTGQPADADRMAAHFAELVSSDGGSG